MSKIVIAFGGNALGNNPKEQKELLHNALLNVIPLIKEGHQIVLTHGNGPQVGVINLAFEKSSLQDKDIPYMPLAECTAMSQGYIGYHICTELKKLLEENNIKKKVVTVVTQVKVDKKDPSFQNPTKPVGPFYDKETAESLMKNSGEVYIEDAGRGYRKVVASPKPLEIVEIDTISHLIDNGCIVVTCGGGGIPVFDNDESVSAVIDKDAASSLLAVNIKADNLIILTNVKQAALNYGKENETKLGDIDLETAKKYAEDGEFAKGSMLPKVNAAINFVEKTSKDAIITDLNNLENALKHVDITRVYKAN